MKEIYKDLIGKDWCGWPINKINIREILRQLGATIVDGRIGFDENDSILDIYPTRLTDDGMGYGVEEEWITDVDVFHCENEEPIIYIWTEPQHNQEEIDTFIKNCECIKEQIKE